MNQQVHHICVVNANFRGNLEGNPDNLEQTIKLFKLKPGMLKDLGGVNLY